MSYQLVSDKSSLLTAHGPGSELRCGSPKAIRKRIPNRISNHVLVLRSKEAPQAVCVHDVLARHVGQGLRRNRRNPLLPEKAENLAHSPFSGHADQLRLRQLDALRKT